MRSLRIVAVLSALLAFCIVATALHYRQQARRTATDAYIPIRALSTAEAAALLLAEDNRAPSDSVRTIIQDVTAESVTLLTRDYVVEVAEEGERVPESHDVVHVSGKNYRLVSNSWERYVCRYEIVRKPLEQMINRMLSPTARADALQSRFDEDSVSFSNNRIWLYVIIETLLVSGLLMLLYCIAMWVHYLLWLPSLAALEFLLCLVVMYYSPAFSDADWFHQRIIVEDIALLGFFPVAIGGPTGVYAILLSTLAYGAMRFGKALINKNIVMQRTYVRAIILVLSCVAAAGLALQYVKYTVVSGEAGRVLGAAKQVLKSERTSRLVDEVKQGNVVPHGNIFEKNYLSVDAMAFMNSILSVRSAGDPELRVLLPVDGEYVFLSRNDHFSYGDLRTLSGDCGHIIDYEYIEPALSSGKDYRMSFGKYLKNAMMREYTRYIEIAVIKDGKDLVSSVAIASANHEH